MRLCRYDRGRLGWVEGASLRDVSEVLALLPACRYPLPGHDLFIGALETLIPEIRRAAAGKPLIPLASVSLSSPLANPGKIIAAPVNYTLHLQEALADKGIHHGNLIEEIHRIGLFLKATSSLAGPSEGVRLTHPERRNDHEIELVAVIGQRGRNIPAETALDYVAGYCVGLDMTVRGPEERSLRKSPDSYTVLGPWLVTADEIGNPSGLELALHVNGERRQSANTRDLVLGVPALIALASSFYTLEPGDVIMTGTPQGVGPVRPGDMLLAEIEGIGAMSVGIRE